jgi:hypothetical protein
MTVFLDTALAYAAADMFVFPCLPRSKAPDGSLVPHGVKEATSEVPRVRRWWSRSPDANIGIAIGIGALFGVRVLDVDPKHGGDRQLARLLERHGAPPTSPAQRSGSGGLHVLFRWPTGDWKTKLVTGVELLGPGRYFVAGPSIHPDTGLTYEWTTPSCTAIAPAPAWLLELAQRRDIEREASPSARPAIAGARYARGALLDAARRVETAPDGDRNNELNKQSFGLSRFVRSGDLNENLVRRVLLDAARVAGLSAFEADRTISSALRARKAL